MRNGRLRQLHTLLDVSGTKPDFLVEGASAFFLERAQNAAASGIGNGVQETIEIGCGGNHEKIGNCVIG